VSDRAQEATSVEGFSRHLLRERELRGLSREDVVRQTKLAQAVVEALESGDAARMPPRAYLVGYLRSYAVAVGLDPDEVVLRWQEVEGGEVPPAAPPLRPPRRRPVVVLILALTALLALAAFLAMRRGPALVERARRATERAPYQQP
jgi:cytoskeletal protein RodZ